MLKLAVRIWRSRSHLPGLWLAGIFVFSLLSTARAQASSLTHPVEVLNDRHRSISGSPIAFPQVISDPTLHLPAAAQSVSRLVLRLGERRLYAYQGDRMVASYPVAVGRDEWETPTGEFTIFQRQQDPAWEHPLTGAIVPPGPENPLGARWLGFWTDGTNSIGFHGTPQEHLIGQAVSHGCVRMHNADVIELYDQVELGTPVVVLP